MYNIKEGDLVCFNSAGMRHKTLGVVMAFDFTNKVERTTHYSILIMWSMVGSIMPRQCWKLQRKESYGGNGPGLNYDIQSGDLVWHELGDWFEVVE